MLYKPSNPSPYNSVVDYNTDNLAFTASCISTSDISDMRLAIKDDSCEYYLPLKSASSAHSLGILDQCMSASSISIPPTNGKLNTTLDVTNGYKITTNNYTRNPLGVASMDGIIKPFTPYRWQLRLYETNYNTNIGYGFVTQAWKMSENSTLKSACYSDQATHILKIRPHTNMFFNIERDTDKGNNEDDFNSFSNVSGLNTTQKNTLRNQLTSYWDENVHYEIEIGGVRAEVVAYYYGNKKNDNTTLSLQTDSYGQPLFAYMEIKADDNLSISEGDEYSIYTNYIDSNEYYFSCRQLGTLKFIDPRITGEDKEVKFVSIDELDKNPDDHTYSPTHSNVQIKGSFDSSSGASVNYYKATLYQVMSNGEDIQMHDSGYVTNSIVDYDCKDLLSGYLYKLVISVTDTYGNTVTKGVYIKPDAHSVVKTTLLSVSPYPEHNSVVLDFGKLISITGEQSNPYDGSYTISTLEGDWCDDVQQYVDVEDDSIQLFSDDEESNKKHVKVNTCAIAPDNTITFSKIDNTGEALKCKEPLISMTFRCNYGSTQTIFDFESDESIKPPRSAVNVDSGIIYKLIWENFQFKLKKYVSTYMTGWLVGSNEPKRFYSDYVLSTKSYSPYGDMKDSWENDIHDAMKGTNKDYSVPYLAYENIRTGANPSDTDGSNIRLHTESPAHDFWWQAIVSSGYVYIKCLNPPDGYDWEYTWGGVTNG